MDLITKIKQANLCGRGGAGFSTGQKWEMVRAAQGEKKYVIANGSEGEPGVLKDSYILDNFPEKVVQGVILAMQAVGAQNAYLYLRADLYAKHKEKLEKIIEDLLLSNFGSTLADKQAGMTITVFREDGKYLNGEETTLLNSIEHKRSEPRYKPPFPTTCGLYQCPTLINNIETFYRVSQIAEEKYKKQRYYSVTGAVLNPGVYEFEIDLPIAQVLEKSGNQPATDYFVQAGGGACGPVYTSQECQTVPLQGAGAVIVHSKAENPLDLLRSWTTFFLNRNCGQCIPCREGFYRLNELLKTDEIDYVLMQDILTVMADASFCGLGQYAPQGYLDLIEKVIKR